MECESGCTRINLEVFFNPAHGHHPQPQEQQQHHRQGQVHQRAARHRRRVRRAQAIQAVEQADKEQVRPDVSSPPPNDVVEPSGHQHRPLPVAEEAFHQATHNRLPIHTVENAALRQTPNPVEEAANYPQHLAGEAVEYPQHQVPYVAGDYDVFPLLEEQQRVVFLLSHILLRRFFLPHLLPYKCLLFGQCTTKRVMVKVMLKTPMSIFKYNLTSAQTRERGPPSA